MDLLKYYDEGSSTPKSERYGQNRDDASNTGETEHLLMTSSAGCDGKAATVSGANLTKDSMDESSSDSDSSGSSSEEDTKVKKNGKAKHTGSDSSDSSDSSSSGESEHGKKAKETQPDSKCRERRASPESSHKVRRRRSRSGSKGRSHSRRHGRSRSTSRDRHRKNSRSERRSGRRSHSRSRDSRKRRDRDRRRRDGHRRRRSRSRDERRRRHHHASSHRRRRRSRSPNHKKPRPSEKSRSRSPRKSRSRSPARHGGRGRKEEGGGNGRSVEFKTAGIKFGRGRGSGSSYKDILRQEYVQQVGSLQESMAANPNQTPVVPSLMHSNVATASAGTGLGTGAMATAMLNQVQQMQRQSLMHVPMTSEQMAINQKALLMATNRTREQVENDMGIKLPSFYNENTNNLREIAATVQKRNKLFKTSTAERRSTLWSAKDVLPGADDAQAQKFARLLGARKHGAVEKEEEEKSKEEREEEERQMRLQSSLMEQYDSARSTTHLNRGAGLGYSTTMYQPLN